MSEEKIIKDLKNFCAISKKEENFTYYSEYKFFKEMAERIQGLLDLYKQEKEKNKSISIQYEKIVDKLEEQEKIIDKFSKALVNCVGTCPIDYNDDFENENDCENCQDTLEKCWIEYFKKVVEKGEQS